MAGLKAGERYKLFTGLVVPRPIAFVSTRGRDGRLNAAPFSFFNVMSSDPPTVVLGINSRPDGPKDSFRNIVETGDFVINIVDSGLVTAMNLCSVDAAPEIDEIALAGLTPVDALVVKAPRIAEAPAHLECRLTQTIPLTQSRALLVGEILHVQADDRVIDAGYRIDARRLDAVGRLGGPQYVHTRDLFELPRPDPEEVLAGRASRP